MTPDDRPVVVIGMHRSGTSLVSRMLLDLGVDMGMRRDSNEESRLYLRLNEWLLHQAGASWFTPAAFADAAQDPEFSRQALPTLARATSMPYAVEHHGLRPSNPWGFKDPRTTITWPIWRQLYPRARLVVVQRNGLDVAKSLAVRAERIGANVAPRTTAVFGLRAPRSGIRHAWAGTDADRALSLWSEYSDLAEQIAAEDGAVSIRYEDLLADPEAVTSTLLSGLGLDADATQRSAAISRVKRGQSSAAPVDGMDLNRARTLLERHGYSLT